MQRTAAACPSESRCRAPRPAAKSDDPEALHVLASKIKRMISLIGIQRLIAA
tara:strand:+ start:357 stop:512 length:156 start_codon:yes stop_codon:yes gene_type:complete